VPIIFTGPGGQDPVSAIKKLVVDALPTEGDGLYAVQRQRSRILKRTAAGVDADRNTFQPYSAAYAKKKAKYRDPGTVDLRGRNAPHMLQAMLVSSGGLQESGESGQPVQELTIGFYDERAAMLARVHNEGLTVPTRLGKGKGKKKKGGVANFRMPKREFFKATDEDVQAMEHDIGSRIEARLRTRQQ
jgi:hypothetical protein